MHPGERFERDTAGLEQCLVLLSGRASFEVDGRDYGTLGGRQTPFDGKPFALYAPPRSRVRIGAQTECELAVCAAPASGRLAPRLIGPDDVGEEVRGTGTNTRDIRHLLPASAEAERLIVVEVVTPGGTGRVIHRTSTTPRATKRLRSRRPTITACRVPGASPFSASTPTIARSMRR